MKRSLYAGSDRKYSCVSCGIKKKTVFSITEDRYENYYVGCARRR